MTVHVFNHNNNLIQTFNDVEDLEETNSFLRIKFLERNKVVYFHLDRVGKITVYDNS